MSRPQIIELVVAVFVACAGLTSVIVRHFEPSPPPIVNVTKPLPGTTAQVEYGERPLLMRQGNGAEVLDNGAGL